MKIWLANSTALYRCSKELGLVLASANSLSIQNLAD